MSQSGSKPIGAVSLQLRKENLDLKEVIIDELRTFIDENGKGGLRDWFKQGGWVDVVDGDACAREKGETATPKCVSRAKRASMSVQTSVSLHSEERKKADPNQPKKSGAAKPTYVSTDKPKKKKSKKKESLDMQLNKDLLLSIIKEVLVEHLEEGAELGHAGDDMRGYKDWQKGMSKPAEPDNVEYRKVGRRQNKDLVCIVRVLT